MLAADAVLGGLGGAEGRKNGWLAVVVGRGLRRVIGPTRSHPAESGMLRR